MGVCEKRETLWSLRHRQADPLGFLTALSVRGDFVPFRLGRHDAVLLNRPDYVEDVLVSHASNFVKGPTNERAKQLLGSGLLTADGALHAARREMIQPAFARRRLEGYAETMVARARQLCDRWRHQEDIDVSRAMGQLTFGILGETVIGANVDHFYEDVQHAVRQATASLDAIVSLVAPLRKVHLQRARLHEVVDRLIDESSRGTRDANSLLSMLAAHDGSPASSDQVRDDLLTILLAGHETIAHALTWTWMLLATHGEVEAQLRKEIAEVLGDRPAVAADVPRLVYTRAVLAESLRLYPPAWVLARRAVEPFRFDAGVVPSGALVLVSQYLLHRDARYFDRPDLFEPGRWLSGNTMSRPKLSYFPFGAGARSCIGEAFGWMEGVLLLASIAQRWRFHLSEAAPVVVDPRITLRPKHGILMRLSDRIHDRHI